MSSFKKEFKPFYQDKFDKKFIKNNDTIISIDTNYLLSILRLEPKVAQKYIDALKSNKDRIYISYFVGLEFSFNKVNVRIDKDNNIRHINTDLDKIKNKLHDNAIKLSKLINSDKEKKMLDLSDKYVEDIKHLIEDKDSLKDAQQDIYDQLIDIIDPLLGNKPDQSFIDEVEEDGIKRYKEGTPPGFNDKDKKDRREFDGLSYDQKYGDLLIWKDLLRHLNGKSCKKFVFVTDDGISNKKNDLFYKYRDNVVGPKIQLIDELNQETGSDLYILDNKSFVSYNVGLDTDDEKQIDNLNDDNYIDYYIGNPKNINNIDIFDSSNDDVYSNKKDYDDHLYIDPDEYREYVREPPKNKYNNIFNHEKYGINPKFAENLYSNKKDYDDNFYINPDGYREYVHEPKKNKYDNIFNHEKHGINPKFAENLYSNKKDYDDNFYINPDGYREYVHEPKKNKYDNIFNHEKYGLHPKFPKKFYSNKENFDDRD